MRLNLLIMFIVGALTYGATLYMDTRQPANHTIILQPASTIQTLTTPEPAPPFTFKTPNGETHALKDFKGKIILLNFWASWCPPCIKEFPHLIKAAQDNPDNLVLIALSSDIDESAMNKFVQKLNLPKENTNIFIALDENQKTTQTLYKSFKLPETLIIDQTQTIRAKIIGADWTDKDLNKHIKMLLGSI